MSVPDSPFNEVSEEEQQEASAEPSPEPSTTQGPIQRLFDGDADGPPVREIETEYNIDAPWSLCVRGLVRTATGTGVPPVVEIVLGAAMGIIARQQNSEQQEQQEKDADAVELVEQ